jgi:hypothetical protein
MSVCLLWGVCCLLSVVWLRQFPEDDGFCSTLATQEQCLAPKTMFDHAESRCAWLEVGTKDTVKASCVYREVEFSVRVRAIKMG